MAGVSTRESFQSQFGIIAAAAGSAIGLGNIWRFPYVTAENGGGAFLFLYVICVIIIGIPVMLSEFSIGRAAQSNAFGSFRKLAPRTPWPIIGFMGIIAAFVILSFYSTVAGWTLEYIFLSLKGDLMQQSSKELVSTFQNFTASSYRPILWQMVIMILTAIIVLGGIQKGIEKFVKILMPVLFLLICVICIRSITLPGGAYGLEFLFKPDFSKVSFRTILFALGQAAFSLSIGMGALITYGSYIQRHVSLIPIASWTATADTLVAILGGVMIFPALFAVGLSPAAGPGLVFITLPTVFQSIPGGNIVAVVFFILLAIAALTSTISVLEVVVAFCIEELKLHRIIATIAATVSISIIGLLCTLSFGPLNHIKIFGMTFFDLMNYVSANIFLTFGALLIVIFTGWKLGLKKFIDEISIEYKGNPKIPLFIGCIIKYFAPIAIGAIAIAAFFVQGLT